VRNIAQAKRFLGLSWRGLAAKITKLHGRGHISHGYLIMMWQGKRPTPNEYIERIGQLIANKLTLRYGREIGIRMRHSSHWRITPVVWCGKCRTFHELKRGNQKCQF
jgi:hypothetical protein